MMSSDNCFTNLFVIEDFDADFDDAYEGCTVELYSSGHSLSFFMDIDSEPFRFSMNEESATVTKNHISHF